MIIKYNELNISMENLIVYLELGFCLHKAANLSRRLYKMLIEFPDPTTSIRLSVQYSGFDECVCARASVTNDTRNKYIRTIGTGRWHFHTKS